MKRHGLSTRCPRDGFLCFAGSLLSGSGVDSGAPQMPWRTLLRLTLVTFLMLWLQILLQGRHRRSPSMDPTLQLPPTVPRSPPARVPPRRRWSELSASWWLNFSAWKSDSARKRRTTWTHRRLPTWEDAPFMATTCGVGRSWWRHSHAGYGGPRSPWRTPHIPSSTSWHYVEARFAQYNDPWLWLGGCKLLRTTRTSANGNWADGKGLSLETSVVPLGLRRSNRRVTASAWGHGGDGSSRCTNAVAAEIAL